MASSSSSIIGTNRGAAAPPPPSTPHLQRRRHRPAPTAPQRAAAAAARRPPLLLSGGNPCSPLFVATRRTLAPPAAAALPSWLGGSGAKPSEEFDRPLWQYVGSAVDPSLGAEQAALLHRLAAARRPEATHVVVVHSSSCAACRACEDEVERFASGLMHELRHLDLVEVAVQEGGAGSNNNSPAKQQQQQKKLAVAPTGRLRVSALDVSQSPRAAEVASRLLGVEELPTAVVFVEGAPGFIRLPPRWRPDRPALTADRLLRAVNLARAKAAALAGATPPPPPLEPAEGLHSPLGRDLLGLPPLWGSVAEEEPAATPLSPSAALERELMRRATAGEEWGEEAAPASEASVVASAAAAMQRPAATATTPSKQQPRPTQLSLVAPQGASSASSLPYYLSQPGKARFWAGIAAASTFLLAWEGLGLQRGFERAMLARRTAARARGVKFSRAINDMDATDLLMDTIERAGAARARAGTTMAKGGGPGGGGRRGAAAARGGRSGGGGGQGGGGPSSSSAEEPGGAIDVVATDVVGRAGAGQQQQGEGVQEEGERRPPPPPPPSTAR